jgi:hypothetical protein
VIVCQEATLIVISLRWNKQSFVAILGYIADSLLKFFTCRYTSCHNEPTHIEDVSYLKFTE